MTKLAHQDLHDIRVWLNTKKVNGWDKCPFPTADNKARRCEVCHTIFPKLASKQEAQYVTETNPFLIGCPCYLYPKSYVLRRARLIRARHGRV